MEDVHQTSIWWIWWYLIPFYWIYLLELSIYSSLHGLHVSFPLRQYRRRQRIIMIISSRHLTIHYPTKYNQPMSWQLANWPNTALLIRVHPCRDINVFLNLGPQWAHENPRKQLSQNHQTSSNISGWWFQPLWKISDNWKNKKCSKPSTKPYMVQLLSDFVVNPHFLLLRWSYRLISQFGIENGHRNTLATWWFSTVM